MAVVSSKICDPTVISAILSEYGINESHMPNSIEVSDTADEKMKLIKMNYDGYSVKKIVLDM
jgi:hypothetical protein